MIAGARHTCMMCTLRHPRGRRCRQGRRCRMLQPKWRSNPQRTAGTQWRRCPSTTCPASHRGTGNGHKTRNIRTGATHAQDSGKWVGDGAMQVKVGSATTAKCNPQPWAWPRNVQNMPHASPPPLHTHTCNHKDRAYRCLGKRKASAVQRYRRGRGCTLPHPSPALCPIHTLGSTSCTPAGRDRWCTCPQHTGTVARRGTR
jgi:hypothetical protein